MPRRRTGRYALVHHAAVEELELEGLGEFRTLVTEVLDHLVPAGEHREDLDDAEALGALLVHDELVALPGRPRLDLLAGLGLPHVLAAEVEDARQLAVRDIDLG